ncbi:hypothetical protein chiPu_0027884 [Chiloscyllium punctatum]|uniref:Uncharacterized protein n=1 Tax=Chiloscyllium punctatum TaxID=137246 RepID=A0A401TMA0_CHIPU|nr:hypothetical protein [Chiloscyllium punctatum]
MELSPLPALRGMRSRSGETCGDPGSCVGLQGQEVGAQAELGPGLHFTVARYREQSCLVGGAHTWPLPR